MQRYKAPHAPFSKVTTEPVRDEPLKLFERASRKFMETLSRPRQDEALKQQARQFSRASLDSSEQVFERPAKQWLLVAVEACGGYCRRG